MFVSGMQAAERVSPLSVLVRGALAGAADFGRARGERGRRQLRAQGDKKGDVLLYLKPEHPFSRRAGGDLRREGDDCEQTGGERRKRRRRRRQQRPPLSAATIRKPT